jgi:RHS repeat-associated protein
MRAYSAPYDYFDVQLNNGRGFDPVIRWEGVGGYNSIVWRTIRAVNSESETHVDIFDINGDGLPDRVMRAYSAPYDHFDVQLNNGRGFDPVIRWEGVGGYNSATWRTIRAVNTDSDTHVDIFDINGDGLPDRVMRAYSAPYDHFDVQLNNGRGFDPVIGWWGVGGDNSIIWRTIRAVNSESETHVDIFDINGDGLPDRVMRAYSAPYDYFDVQLNNGRGFDPVIRWEGVGGYNNKAWRTIRAIDGNSDTHVDIFDINGDGLPDRVMRAYSAPYDYFDVQLNNGRGFDPVIRWEGVAGYNNTAWRAIRAVSDSDTHVDIFDINGDGLPDRVMRAYSAPYDYFDVQRGSDFYPDLLSCMDNGIGGTINISYVFSTQFQNTGSDNLADLPFPVPVVSSITTQDGQGNSYITTYDYKNGAYSYSDREFRGFGYVKTTDAQGNYVEAYFKQDDIYKSRPYRQETKDASGNLFAKTENTWQNIELFPGVNFTSLASTDSFVYDGDASFKQTRASFQYDSYGNPTRVTSEGEVGITGDEKTQVTEYNYNTSGWLLASPKHTWLLDANQQLVSEKWFYYDNAASIDTTPTKGDLTKEEALVYNPITLASYRVAANYAYDTFGNLISATDALGRTTSTAYDTTLYTYPVSVTNTLGQTMQSTYDFRTGQVLTTTDTNNQTGSNTYDTFGRLLSVIGPNDTADYPSARYFYDLNTFPIKISQETKTDYALPPAYLTSYSFYDGIGRVIQSKSPAEPDPETGQQRQIVSGIVKLDSRGLVKEQYIPYFVNASPDYVAPTYATPHSTLTYDAVGRLIQSTNPDTTYATVQYSDWVKTVTDENGHSKTEYYDVYGRIIKVEEHNSSQIYTTTYEYDALGNLIKVTDNQNNSTHIWYDSLGRKLKMDDPDMGIWTYEYDVAGNLIKQTDAKAQVLEFEYDTLNRLTKKRNGAITLVTYQYDDAAKQNCKGRLSKITDQSGSSEFFYDNLGREIRSTKVVAGTSYTVERTYDALDRLVTLKYPDTSVIKYEYNPQGIEKVRNLSPTTSDLITNINYSPTGQILKVQYGNGAETTYAYDPLTLRLANVVTQSSSGKIQDLRYQFDNSGNVQAITDYVNTNSQSFLYDDLDRLIQAQGAYGTFSYGYDSIGNMINKEGVSLTYGKVGKLPHAVTQFGNTSLDYDANGNMIKKANLELAYDAESRLIQVEDKSAEEPVTLSISLSNGWNFISFPMGFADANVGAVLSSISGKYDQVARYNAVTKTAEYYVGDPQYDQFSTFDYGRGYQIYITDPNGATLTVTGTLPIDANLSLKSGYNLIFCPKTAETPVEEALKPLKMGIDYDKVLHYNKQLSLFEKYDASTHEFTTFNPGESYYLNCLKDTTWVVTNSKPTTIFTYDGDGGRVTKDVVASQGHQVTTYIGSLFEKDSSGATRKHIFAGANRIATAESARSIYFYHSDHLGSSNVVTDQSGYQAGLTEFTPFGSISRQEGTYDPQHKFTGKELDENGLYFYGARYYDPQLGRFISADTVVQAPYDPQSLNRYSYCRNNPINYVDPTGHSFWDFFGKVLGTIAAVVTFVATAGNVGAAFAAFNITDTVVSGGQALYSGAPPGPVLGAIGMSITLNCIIPTPSCENLFMQVGLNATRGAFIATATTAAIQGGGKLGPSAAWGGGMGGLGGFIDSQQLNNACLGQGFRSNRDVRAEVRNLDKLETMLKTDGTPTPEQSIDQHSIIETYTRGLEGGSGSLRVHPAMKDVLSDNFYELTVTPSHNIDVLKGPLGVMTAATQNYITMAAPDRATIVYNSMFNASMKGYEYGHVGKTYIFGSVERDCRGIPYRVIKSAQLGY